MSSFFDGSFSVEDFANANNVQRQSTGGAIPLHAELINHPNSEAYSAFLQYRALQMPAQQTQFYQPLMPIIPPHTVSAPIISGSCDTSSQVAPTQTTGSKRKGRPLGSKNKPKANADAPSSGTKKETGRVKWSVEERVGDA